MKKQAANIQSRNKMRWVWLALGAGVVASIAWFMSMNWEIEKINIQGNFFTETQQIIEQANISKGTHPDSISAMHVIEAVEKLPYVKNVDYIHEPPISVRLKISERTPIAMIADGSVKVYVDNEGIKLPVIDGKAMDVPLLFGFSTSFSDTLNDDSFAIAQEFLVLCKTDAVLNTTISEVIVHKSEGLVALTQENGVKLIFGAGNLNEKIQIWKSFISEVISNEGFQSFSSVDFRYKDQIVVRKS